MGPIGLLFFKSTTDLLFFPRKRGKIRNNPIFEEIKGPGLVTLSEGISTINVYSIL